MKPAWLPDWSGQIAAVVASGSSAADAGIEQIRGRARVLVINNGFELVPWADVLYAADAKWWEAYPAAHQFAGLKLTADGSTAKRLKIDHVNVAKASEKDAHRFLIEKPGDVGHGGHGGFQALNLAVQFGARRILLVGYDLGGAHWHKDHRSPLQNPRRQTMAKWRERMEREAPRLAELGIEVINCSPISTLRCFPVKRLVEALC